MIWWPLCAFLTTKCMEEFTNSEKCHLINPGAALIDLMVECTYALMQDRRHFIFSRSGSTQLQMPQAIRTANQPMPSMTLKKFDEKVSGQVLSTTYILYGCLESIVSSTQPNQTQSTQPNHLKPSVNDDNHFVWHFSCVWLYQPAKFQLLGQAAAGRRAPD